MTESSQPDAFESELLSIHPLDKDALTRLEQNMGLGGGGSWWIDPSQPPVELNAHGERDEGAILDVEAQVRAWLRHSFDKNPQFRDHSYHLLSRLNELARLQGLVEQAQLLQQSTDIGDQDRDPKLYHSTLSLRSTAVNNLGASYDLAQPTFALHHFDVHRSLEGSLSQHHNQRSYDSSPQGQQGSYSGYGSPATERLSLSSSQLSGPIAHHSLYEAALLREPIAKPSGMPQMHKGHNALRTNLDYHNTTYKRPSNPDMLGQFPTPDVTSSPDRSYQRRKTILSRTYSKEQLQSLRADDDTVKHKQSSSLLDSLQRFRVTSSLPLSDPDSDIDVTKSLDIPSSSNPLSQSLSETDMTHGTKLNPNASYSNMRSSDVIEMARLQESHLRKHSGSRNKLYDSNNSLTGSLRNLNVSGRRQNQTGDSSGSSVQHLSDVDLSQSHESMIMFNDARLPPERQITIRPKDKANIDEENRRTLIMMDSAALPEPLENLPGARSETDNNLSEPPTPVVSNQVARPDSFELLELRMSSDPASPGTLKVINPDFDTLESSNGPHAMPAALAVSVSGQSESVEIPGTSRSKTLTSTEPKQLASMSSEHTARLAYKRPPMSPRVSGTTAVVNATGASRLPTSVPVKSKIPAPSVRSIPAPSQRLPNISQRSRPVASQSSAQSSSRSRSGGAMEPVTQPMPRNPPSGNISSNAQRVAARPVGSKATNMPSRPTSRPSRSTDATAATTQLKVTRSDTSPVRSTRMTNKRFGQRPSVSNTRRS